MYINLDWSQLALMSGARPSCGPLCKCTLPPWLPPQLVQMHTASLAALLLSLFNPRHVFPVCPTPGCLGWLVAAVSDGLWQPLFFLFFLGQALISGERRGRAAAAFLPLPQRSVGMSSRGPLGNPIVCWETQSSLEGMCGKSRFLQWLAFLNSTCMLHTESPCN